MNAPTGGQGDGPAHPPTEDDAKDVLDATKRGKEMEKSEDENGGSNGLDDTALGDVPGLKLLNSLTRATLFTDLFIYHSRLRYRHATVQERVSHMADRHPRFYKYSRIADFVARIVILTIVVSLLAVMVFGFVYRTLFADLSLPPDTGTPPTQSP